MAKKFYAVKKGYQPGIYTSWPECQRQVSGYAGAVYKGFPTRNAAAAWLKGEDASSRPQQLSLSLGANDTTAAAIRLYTDGGSRNHGNKRGQHVKSDDKAAWAYLIEYRQQRITGTGGEFGATNNKMEVTALIKALEYLIDHHLNNETILATLDSHYVLDPIMKGWLYGWNRRGWVTASGSPVANRELWQTVLHLLPQFSQLRFSWTKGHAINQGNNTVDELLNETMDKMERN
ncbi:MAG: ribonuclease H family protein [Lactobacillaceae bacterium]|nr:ribonuclease H family protein [Lactobacillaceae bacterium]